MEAAAFAQRPAWTHDVGRVGGEELGGAGAAEVSHAAPRLLRAGRTGSLAGRLGVASTSGDASRTSGSSLGVPLVPGREELGVTFGVLVDLVVLPPQGAVQAGRRLSP